jgi:hypothetical protein
VPPGSERLVRQARGERTMSAEHDLEQERDQVAGAEQRIQRCEQPGQNGGRNVVG